VRRQRLPGGAAALYISDTGEGTFGRHELIWLVWRLLLY
jgi:hypothetical protein